MIIKNQNTRMALLASMLENRFITDEMSDLGFEWEDLEAICLLFINAQESAAEEEEPMPKQDEMMAMFCSGISLGVHFERLRRDLND